ncbi:MAG: CC0125/CC1285 family lipoprotein [Planctomycetota bacterium]|jgi:hypothetical protein
MNKLIISATLVLITGLFGCRATPYQRLGTTSAGGYSEKAMSEDTFYVKFSANNHTSSKIVCRYLYRRAAEVTLRHGFLFFTVIRGPSPLTDRVSFYSSEDSYNDMAAPIEIDVPQSNRLQMVIQCFREMPEQRDMRPVNAQEYLEKHVRPRTK